MAANNITIGSYSSNPAPAQSPQFLVNANSSPIEATGTPNQMAADAKRSASTEAARLALADAQIQKIMNDIDVKGMYSPTTTALGGGAFDPDLYTKSVQRLGNALGKSGLAMFAAEQLGLFLLNRHGKIWNPATIAPMPISINFVPAALDVLTGTPPVLTGYNDTIGSVASDIGFYATNHTGPSEGTPLPGQDIHYDLAKGQYNEVRIVHYPPFVETIIAGGRSGIPGGGLGSHLGANSQLQSLVFDPITGRDGSLGLPLVDAALAIRNAYHPEVSDAPALFPDRFSTRQSKVPIDALVDDIIDNTNNTNHLKGDPNLQGIKRFTYRQDQGFEGEDQSFVKNLILQNTVRLNKHEFVPDPGEKVYDMSQQNMSRAIFINGIIPSRFNGENPEGFILTKRGASQTDVISDDDAYMPLSITDLRPIGGSNKYRTIFFRPLNVKIQETFSPQWNKANYFGRVDAVATYEATGRAITLSWDLIAFCPEDLQNIYQKQHWLTSMVYPSYDKNLLYTSGPVCRIRVGDVINALGAEGCRGLPGIIEGLSFDYSEAIWELKSGIKVPRNINVNMNFTILHEKPIGIGADGKFGGIGTIADGKYYAPALENQIPKAGGTTNGDMSSVKEISTYFRDIPKVVVNSWVEGQDIDNNVLQNDKNNMHTAANT